MAWGRTVLLFNIEKKSLSLPLGIFVSNHVGSFPGIVFQHAIGSCFHQNLDECLGAMLGCMV